MYVIMCEIRKHSNPYNVEADETTLVSAHPIDLCKTWEDTNAWMFREPEIIVDYLNNVTEDEWWLTPDRNESHAVINNKTNTTERMYVARRVNDDAN